MIEKNESVRDHGGVRVSNENFRKEAYNIQDNHDVNYHWHNPGDISEEKSSNNSDYVQEVSNNFYVNCGYESNLSLTKFININNNHNSNHSRSQMISNRELWKESDLIVKEKDSEKSQTTPNSSGKLKNIKPNASHNIEVMVDLDDLNSRQTNTNNTSYKPKSPFKNKIATFIRNRNDNNVSNSPTGPNIFKQQLHNQNSVINLNTASNLTNISNFSANSRSNVKVELDSNQTKQSINKFITNFSQAEILNNSKANFNTSRPVFFPESPSLGKKNKRKSSNLKSVDKNPNMKQMTISSMFKKSS